MVLGLRGPTNKGKKDGGGEYFSCVYFSVRFTQIYHRMKFKFELSMAVSDVFFETVRTLKCLLSCMNRFLLYQIVTLVLFAFIFFQLMLYFCTYLISELLFTFQNVPLYLSPFSGQFCSTFFLA